MSVEIDRLYQAQQQAEAKRDALLVEANALQRQLTEARRRLKAAQAEWERASTAWCDALDSREAAR